MEPPSSTVHGLREARVALDDGDLEFVLDGVDGLPPSRAFVVLDALREILGWDQDVHLDLVEHVIGSSVVVDLFVRR